MASLKTIEPAPPGEEDNLLPAEASIEKLLDEFKEAPLIGLEYLVEILDDLKPPVYKCELCDTNLEANVVVADLISANHRLKYLKRYYPTASKKFEEVPNTRNWRTETFDFLESVVMRIENKNGRLKPQVVASQRQYVEKAVKSNIAIGKHFRQTPDQDFSSLPDPFAGYRDQLSESDFNPGLKFDKNRVVQDPATAQIHIGADLGLDGYVEDPQMQSLMQREIAR